jgi:hypothetical protein
MDHLMHLEANLDDMTPEHLAYAIDILLRNGAVDAWISPIVMKKGRPAHTLHCLCHTNVNHDPLDDDSIENKFLAIMFQHTTTLGVRISSLDRAALPRSLITVVTPYQNTTRAGQVNVKVGYLNNEIVSMKAEFDHCREISEETGITLKNISDTAVRLALEQLKLKHSKEPSKKKKL